MPRVPTYDGPQVQEQATRGGYQENIDVSKGARALAAGLGDVAQVVDRVVVRDAQDEAFKIEQQVRSDWQKQRGALRAQYKADNADEYKAKAEEWWTKAKDTYGAAASPMARAAASKSIGSYMVQAEADTIGYVEGEKTKSREINFRTLQENIITEAGQTVTPENARVVSAATAATIEKNAIKYAAGEGLSSDVGKKMAREQLDKFHSETAISLADKDAVAARAYLNEFGKDIPLGLRTRIDSAVTKNFNDQEGKRISQSLAGLQTLAEKEEALAEIDNAELREAATTHVYRDQTRLTAVKTEATKTLLGNAKLSYEKTGRVPPTLMAALEAADRGVAADLMRGIKTDEKAKAREAKGEEIKTDYAAWQLAYDRIAQGEQVDLLQYRNAVSRGDLMGLRKELENRNKPDAEKDVATTTQIIATYTGGFKAEKKGAFTQVFLDEIEKFKNEKKRPATYDEKRKIGDRLVIDGEVLSGSFFLNDPNKKYYEATPEQRTRFAPTIASGDRKLVKDALMAEGVKNPTEAQIVERFKLAKGFR